MAYRDEVLADSPVRYYRLGESSGTTATDETATANGTYVNTPTLGVTGALTGDADTAVTFTRAQSEGVTCNGSGRIISGIADATVECWVKHPAVGTGTAAELAFYCERNNGSGNDIFKVGFTSTAAGAAANGCIELTYRDSAGTLNRVQTPAEYDDNNWHHVVMTKDNTAIVIYVDGASVQTGTLTATDTLTNAGTQSWIARDFADTNAYLDGTLDEVALYTSALSSTRVSAHYTAGTSGGGAPAARRLLLLGVGT